MSSTLSRSHFDQGCKDYVDAHPNHQSTEVKSYTSGWVWKEHPYISKLGYLSRTVHLPSKHTRTAESDDDDDGMGLVSEDSAVVMDVPGQLLTCNQYVVHSATFEVPTFYFTLHDSSGSPLPLEQI